MKSLRVDRLKSTGSAIKESYLPIIQGLDVFMSHGESNDENDIDGSRLKYWLTVQQSLSRFNRVILKTYFVATYIT